MTCLSLPIAYDMVSQYMYIIIMIVLARVELGILVY